MLISFNFFIKKNATFDSIPLLCSHSLSASQNSFYSMQDSVSQKNNLDIFFFFLFNSLFDILRQISCMHTTTHAYISYVN